MVVGAAVVVVVVVVVVGAAVVVGTAREGLPFEHPSTTGANRTNTPITGHVPHRTPNRTTGRILTHLGPD